MPSKLPLMMMTETEGMLPRVCFSRVVSFRTHAVMDWSPRSREVTVSSFSLPDESRWRHSNFLESFQRIFRTWAKPGSNQFFNYAIVTQCASHCCIEKKSFFKSQQHKKQQYQIILRKYQECMTVLYFPSCCIVFSFILRKQMNLNGIPSYARSTILVQVYLSVTKERGVIINCCTYDTIHYVHTIRDNYFFTFLCNFRNINTTFGFDHGTLWLS